MYFICYYRQELLSCQEIRIFIPNKSIKDINLFDETEKEMIYFIGNCLGVPLLVARGIVTMKNSPVPSKGPQIFVIPPYWDGRHVKKYCKDVLFKTVQKSNK